MTTVGGQHAVSAEDRLSLLIDRLLTSMDAAAAAGAWDRVVELANDVLTVDPPNQRAAAMIERASLERSLPEGERAFVSLIFADIVQSTDMAEMAEPEVVQEVFAVYRLVATTRSRNWAVACCSSRATASWRASAIPPRTATTPAAPCRPVCASSNGWPTPRPS